MIPLILYVAIFVAAFFVVAWFLKAVVPKITYL